MGAGTGGETLAVLGGLRLDAGEGRALLLGLDGADGLPVDEEEVIGLPEAGLERELADGHAAGGMEVSLFAVLDGPAGLRERGVDLAAGEGLGGAHGAGP